MRRGISILGALLALGVFASPGFAACEGSAAYTPADPSAMVPENDSANVPDRLVGEVLAVDAKQGRLVLATDAGAIALRGSPEVLGDLEVGDVIEVVLDEPLEQQPLEPAGYRI